MVTTFCTSGSVVYKAGANVSSSITEDQWIELINQAEGYINTVTRINYVDTYSGLNDDVKKILQDAASCHAAISAINFDMSGYTSRSEAQTMLDVNWARLMENIELLKDKKYTTFITEA